MLALLVRHGLQVASSCACACVSYRHKRGLASRHRVHERRLSDSVGKVLQQAAPLCAGGVRGRRVHVVARAGAYVGEHHGGLARSECAPLFFLREAPLGRNQAESVVDLGRGRWEPLRDMERNGEPLEVACAVLLPPTQGSVCCR